jgi:signal transduction histidine kinase
VAALLGLAVLTGVLGEVSEDAPWPLAAAATLALVAPLAVRRLWPVPVMVTVLVVSLALWWGGPVREPMLAAAYALYPVALAPGRRTAGVTFAVGVLAAAALGLGVLAGAGSQAVADRAGDAVVAVLALGASWVVGRSVRAARTTAARLAEAHAAAAVSRAVAAERLRIAREVHDVVSGTISLMGVKAAVARHVADTRPEEVPEALAVIEAAGRDALGEMRRLLWALRSDGPSAAADLVRTTAWATDAGVRLDIAVDPPDGIPAIVAPDVHRIVHEAVTNVVRHAAPTTCQVRVRTTPADVCIEVTDDGPAHGRRTRSATGGSGLGLLGMRERVLGHGGTFSAGPRDSGGFAVVARLPGPA